MPLFSVQGFFLILSMLSHLGASVFLARPRFGKAVTAAIWLLYGAFFLLLPMYSPALNFFMPLIVHMVLYFITTTGRRAENGFLFLSYANLYICCGTVINILIGITGAVLLQLLLAVLCVALMQVLLYAVLLPSFRKVMPYIQTGWHKFYAIVIVFLVLFFAETLIHGLRPMTLVETVIFLLTLAAFATAYLTVFSGMKSVVELTLEKRKQIHTELLQEQVTAQAKEAELVRRNRHDLRHHYDMLLTLAHEGELEKITAYLERQTERIESVHIGRFCENETVNNILRVFQRKAEERGISMEISAAAKPTLAVPDPELVAIIANVLENALHGAAESGASEPWIRVSLKHRSGRFVMRCENVCLPSLQFEEMPEPMRGTGVLSIIATAEKFNGACRFSAEEGAFCAMVVVDE